MDQLQGGNVVARAGNGVGAGLDGMHEAGHWSNEGIGDPQPRQGDIDQFITVAGIGQRIGAAVRVIVHRPDGAADNARCAEKAERGSGGARGVVVIDHHARLEPVGIVEDGDGLGFGTFRLAWIAGVATRDRSRVAEQVAQAVEVVDAVVHDIEVFRIAEPWPHVPRGIGTDPDLGIGRLADDAAADEVDTSGNPGAPAHLLVDRDVSLRAFASGSNGNRVGEILGKGFLAEEVFAGGERLFGDGALFPGGDGDVDDTDCGIGQ